MVCGKGEIIEKASEALRDTIERHLCDGFNIYCSRDFINGVLATYDYGYRGKNKVCFKVFVELTGSN